MSIDLTCQQCGQVCRIEKARSEEQIDCQKCGSRIAAIPPPAFATARPVAEADDEYTMAPLETDEVLVASRPVSPRSTPTGSLCKNCQASLPPKAVLCVSCGLDLRTGTKLHTIVERSPGQIELHWQPAARVGLVATGAIFAMPALISFLMLFSTPPIDVAITFLFTLLFFGFLSANLLALAVRQGATVSATKLPNESGRIAIKRRFGFWTLKSSWSADQFVSVCYVQKRFSMETPLLIIMLCLLCAGFIPGVVFWVLLRKGDQFQYRVDLFRKEGGRIVLYRGNEFNKSDVSAIVRMIHEVIGISRSEEIDLGQ